MLISICLLLFIGGSLAVQTWEEQPRYTEVNPGDNSFLYCKIYNKKGTCSWQKDGKPQGMFSGKIEWAGNQKEGDCSIRILESGEVDDGEWECQVTASSFSAHDALTSQIAQLVVRVPPKPPKLEVGSSHLSSPSNFTVKEGEHSSIKCIARYGNPPPKLKWFLGSEEIFESMYNQTNDTEIDRPKTWRATSVLSTSFVKRDHGRPLRCISVHEAYPTRSIDASIPLDVQYSPTVTLQGAPVGDIEEGKDRVALQCLADANPPANIIWKRIGDNNIFSFQETIEFSPATRKHTGKYSCKASNSVGFSDPLSVTIDVKYPPKVEKVIPDPTLTATLDKPARINCIAVGNPEPSFEWFQVTPTGKKIKQGNNSTLIINNITYEYQGQYFCVAHNVIKGHRKDHHSKPVKLEVVGAPQVIRSRMESEVEAVRGDDALVQMVFCSDPPPIQTTWQWGSQQLNAGNSRGRYTAQRLTKDNANEDCYLASLQIHDVDLLDARNYYLTVQNEKGADRYAVALIIKEPVLMSTVIGTVVTCLVILVIVTLIILYAFKTERCCFAPASDDFKPADIENNRNNLDSGHKIGNELTGTNGNTNHINGDEKTLKEQQLQQLQYTQQYGKPPEQTCLGPR